MICLEGELRRAAPTRLRYALLHVAARIVKNGRRVYTNIQRTWPWVDDLSGVFERLRLHASG